MELPLGPYASLIESPASLVCLACGADALAPCRTSTGKLLLNRLGTLAFHRQRSQPWTRGEDPCCQMPHASECEHPQQCPRALAYAQWTQYWDGLSEEDKQEERRMMDQYVNECAAEDRATRGGP